VQLAAHDLQKQVLERRHAAEIETEQAGWRTLSAERDRAWNEWRKEFDIKPRPAPARTGKAPPAPEIDGGLKDQFPAAPDKPRRRQAGKSAAERRADGSYRGRDRKGPTLDR
jgi:hypothetical protein